MHPEGLVCETVLGVSQWSYLLAITWEFCRVGLDQIAKELGLEMKSRVCKEAVGVPTEGQLRKVKACEMFTCLCE